MTILAATSAITTSMSAEIQVWRGQRLVREKVGSIGTISMSHNVVVTELQLEAGQEYETKPLQLIVIQVSSPTMILIGHQSIVVNQVLVLDHVGQAVKIIPGQAIEAKLWYTEIPEDTYPVVAPVVAQPSSMVLTAVAGTTLNGTADPLTPVGIVVVRDNEFGLTMAVTSDAFGVWTFPVTVPSGTYDVTVTSADSQQVLQLTWVVA